MDLLKILETLKRGESENVEFKEKITENLAKEICAFANSSGGEIYIGVTDSGDPVGISEDSKYIQTHSNILQGLTPYQMLEYSDLVFDSKKIVLIKVKKSPHLVSYKNIVYVRVGTNNYPLSIQEVLEKSSEGLNLYFDQGLSDLPINSMDKLLFKNYLLTRQQIRGVDFNDDIVDNLKSLNLARLTKDTNNYVLINASVLCFTKNPQDVFPNTSVKLVKFSDTSMQKYSERKDYRGSLLSIVDDLDHYFKSNISRVGGYLVGFKNREFYEYPLTALREAVINAIVHRNYYDPGDTQIFLFPDRIEIRNPGGFPLGVTENNPIHKPRNPILAQIFFDYGYTDRNGSGIHKIKKLTLENPFTEVQIESIPYMTKVTFKRTAKQDILDDISKNILELISISPKSTAEIARYIGLSRQATLTRIKNLQQLKIVNVVGTGASTRYTTIKH